jgi:hypothetical protein
MINSKTNLRSLGKAREMAQASGFDISYAYDDLVFSEHNVFIIKFHERDYSKLYLYFNIDCDPKVALSIEQKMIKYGPVSEMGVVRKGFFSIKQAEDKEELELSFME